MLALLLPAIAAQADDHLQPAMSGKLVALDDNSISVRNDTGARTFRVTRETRIWRGAYVNIHHLHLGDDIDLQYRASASGPVALAIWANTDRWAGTITRVTGTRVEIAMADGLGRATILFDRNTIFNQGEPKNLRVGSFLEVVGLVISKDRMQATRVLHIDPR